MINRGNHQQAVFRTEEDRRCFLDTLGEVCARTGWRVHAYVLMGNHYHLLLETPEPNLVSGMQWLQGTYTKRFNAIHRESGHLFQGRYKAIAVDTQQDYFSAVATYIHLNPARMRGYNFATERLVDFRWSSYPGYVRMGCREPWLCVDRVLGGLCLENTRSGRARYGQYMTKRVREVAHAGKPWEADEQWQRIRRGWCFGGDDFRGRMLERIADVVGGDKGTPFGGAPIQEHNEEQAERLIVRGLKRLNVQEADLERMKKTVRSNMRWPGRCGGTPV